MILKAQKEDIKALMDIINEAKLSLRKQGINQWQDGYPNEDTLLKDIEKERLYLLKKEEIVGVFALLDYEATYDVIDGVWKGKEPYVAIHRVAIKESEKGKGLAKEIFDEVKKMHKTIRIDTHKDNRSMRKCLLKNGFYECGIITLMDGSPRIAYEYVGGEDEDITA